MSAPASSSKDPSGLNQNVETGPHSELRRMAVARTLRKNHGVSTGGGKRSFGDWKRDLAVLAHADSVSGTGNGEDSKRAATQQLNWAQVSAHDSVTFEKRRTDTITCSHVFCIPHSCLDSYNVCIYLCIWIFLELVFRQKHNTVINTSSKRKMVGQVSFKSATQDCAKC